MALDCDEALDNDHIRQGDVFRWENSNRKRPWQVYGLVVTADCDLVKGKTGGNLSYVPILLYEDYVWTFLRPTFFSKFQGDTRAACVKRLNSALNKNDPTHIGISEDAVEIWIKRLGVSGVLKELSFLDKGQLGGLKPMLERFQSVTALMGSDEPLMELLLKMYAEKENLSSDAPKRLSEKIASHVCSLPGDVFYMSAVGSLEEHGVFAMLRHITQCKITDIAIQTDDVLYRGASARRVARLKSPYRFALTQNLAKIFSDIGLPSDYEQSRTISSSRYVQSIFGGVL